MPDRRTFKIFCFICTLILMLVAYVNEWVLTFYLAIPGYLFFMLITREPIVIKEEQDEPDYTIYRNKKNS